jgi:hypothetical protein
MTTPDDRHEDSTALGEDESVQPINEALLPPRADIIDVFQQEAAAPQSPSPEVP